ncbi:MAG: tRNA preQ1(34) S-adenosylmethionine ribosyltransferase-isomerase QueA [Betaproteobacteria bacterium]|nr:tRNA preQ1(34) S-adenosylmethionine ribosyltransferase-isomerase QueA [Betaproteobacteria bacterium]
MLTIHDFDFALPEELIAQHPAMERSGSRLLQVCGRNFSDRRFLELPTLIAPEDVLVLNDTKVIKARFWGRKESGGQVEVLLERIMTARHALAQIRASRAPKAGARLMLAEGAFAVRVMGREGDFFALELEGNEDFWMLAESHGSLPLPPYITHKPEAEDERRYQTVYAHHPGAVAAPTAGLHFDDDLLARLHAAGIQTARLTLHVGAGTFQPVRVENIAEHRMHRERYSLPPETREAIQRARKKGRRVIAVGTTTLRALESAALDDDSGLVRAGEGETDIFITPGYSFRVVDRLITNFHLPRSTLLMLVSALAGLENIRAAYAHAIRERYRFFSYGDAMLLDKCPADGNTVGRYCSGN